MLRIGPIWGLSADGNITPQKRKKEEAINAINKINRSAALVLSVNTVCDSVVNVCLLAGMFDRDQSGTIELHEFQGLWNYLSQWRTLFDQFDRDRSGTIDAGELTTGLISASLISSRH